MSLIKNVFGFPDAWEDFKADRPTSITVTNPLAATPSVLANTTDGIHPVRSEKYIQNLASLDATIKEWDEMQAAQKRVSAFDTPEMRFTIIPQGTTTGRITSTEPNTSNTPKSESPSIKVKLADPKAMPLRAHDTDAGADLYCTTTSAIFPGDSMLLDTGVAIQIPVGYVGLVLPRSSHGKIRVSLANTVGVIDSSYRGNIKLLLVNEGVKPYIITAYDTRIAQLVITPIVLAQFTAVDSLEDTERGTGGFGSTNK